MEADCPAVNNQCYDPPSCQCTHSPSTSQALDVEWRPDDYGRPSHAAALAKAAGESNTRSGVVSNNSQSHAHGKIVPNAAAIVQVAMLDMATYETVLSCRSQSGGISKALGLLAPLQVYVIDLMKGQVSSVVLVALLSALMRR